MRRSLVMQRGEQIDTPESQQHEDKGCDGSESKLASALGEFPAHQDEAQIKQPHQAGPNYFRIGAVMARVKEPAQVISAGSQSKSKQNKTAQEQASGNELKSLDRWQARKQGLEFPEFQIPFLGEIHQRGDRTQAKGAVGQAKQGSMDAD